MKTQAKFQREKPLFSERPEYKSIGHARQTTNKQARKEETRGFFGDLINAEYGKKK